MNWSVMRERAGAVEAASQKAADDYDGLKKELAPVMEKEAVIRQDLEPIHFQPVRSPGIYEAEFGQKREDILFHFWPYGYHAADNDKKVLPRFPNGFPSVLLRVMTEIFKEGRVEMSYDADMGSWFVKAKGWGSSMFARELSIKACEGVHKGMGGQEA